MKDPTFEVKDVKIEAVHSDGRTTRLEVLQPEGGSITFEAQSTGLEELFGEMAANGLAKRIAQQVNRPPGGSLSKRPPRDLDLELKSKDGQVEEITDGWYLWGLSLRGELDPSETPPICRIIQAETTSGSVVFIFAQELRTLRAEIRDELSEGKVRPEGRIDLLEDMVDAIDAIL